RKRMRALGQGLMGCSLAVLYVSIFAGFSLYELMPQTAAFGAMVLVTAAGVTLAILHDALPLGFIAVLGGLLTPVMLSTGEDSRDALFAYLTVLDLGVLGVGIFKRWRALDILAFAGTWLLFAGWFSSFYREAAMVPALLWMGVFFIIFLVVPFAYQLRLSTPSAIESFTMALANAAVFFSYAFWILREDYQYVLGFIALGMTVCYVTLGALFRRRVPEDARSIFGFVALSVIFLTMAVPLHLRVHGITLAWAIEGPVLLYLGYVYRYQPVRIAGFLVICLAVGRLFLRHWPEAHGDYTLFFNEHFATSMCVPIAGAAYALIHHRLRSQADRLDLILMAVTMIGAGFLALLIFHHETYRWLYHWSVDHKMRARYLPSCAITAIWSLGALGFLAGAVLSKSRVSYYAGIGALAAAILCFVYAYGHDRRLEYMIFLNFRFGASLVLVIAGACYAVVAYGYGNLFSQTDRPAFKPLAIVAGLIPLALLSCETYTYCYESISSRRKARYMAQMSLSIVWGLYAVTGLAVGFWKKVKELRLAALVLLAVVSIKLVLVDLATLKQIYRIVSFVVLGMLMILASYLYHRLEKRLG
ncbi:DUF2339 domain-containing protein, partial [Thermodesulfobacteriota bacterium]